MEALTRVRQRSLGQPPDGGAAGTEGRTSRTWASMFLAVCVKRVPKASSTNAADMPSVEAGEAGRRQERGLRSLAKITEVMGVHQRPRSSLHEIDSMAFWETKKVQVCPICARDYFFCVCVGAQRTRPRSHLCPNAPRASWQATHPASRVRRRSALLTPPLTAKTRRLSPPVDSLARAPVQVPPVLQC